MLSKTKNMLVEEKKFQDENGVIGYYEAIYDSSNILKTTYFPQRQTLYISFNRGGVYSYSNVSIELYEEFKAVESQGKFFAQTIKKEPQNYPYRKEFTLYPNEVKELKEVVEKSKKEEEYDPDDDFIVEYDEHNGKIVDIPEANNLIFWVRGKEIIRVNPDGFYWMGKLIQEDKEIYDKFKLFLEMSKHDVVVPKEHESGVINLMKNVLKFYANKDNYNQKPVGNDLSSMIELDNGEQARKIVELIDKLEKEDDKMKEEYERIVSEELKNIEDPEKIKDMMNKIKNNIKDGS